MKIKIIEYAIHSHVEKKVYTEYEVNDEGLFKFFDNSEIPFLVLSQAVPFSLTLRDSQ